MTKPKKRAPARKSPAARRRAPARGRAGKPARPAAKAAPVRPRRGRALSPAAPAAPAASRITPEQQIVGAVFLGKVMNYFSHLGVISITLEAPLAAGDMIRIKGHTTDLTQKVDTIQVNHQNVQSAGTGEAVGLKVADKTRPGDAVYKV